MSVRNFAIVAVLMFATWMFGQSTPQTPPPGAQGQSGAGATTSTQAKPGTHAGMGMGAMHAQHMQEMQKNVAQMESLLNNMRANLASMDPKDQPAMRNNIELWQMMIDHMKQMAQHMESMGGPGMMHEHMMGGPGAQGGMTHQHGSMGTAKEGTPGTGTSKPVPLPPPQQR